MAISNKRVWYRYSNVQYNTVLTRATVLFTVSNGNEVTDKLFYASVMAGREPMQIIKLLQYNGNDVIDTCFAYVTVTK